MFVALPVKQYRELRVSCMQPLDAGIFARNKSSSGTRSHESGLHTRACSFVWGGRCWCLCVLSSVSIVNLWLCGGMWRGGEVGKARVTCSERAWRCQAHPSGINPSDLEETETKRDGCAGTGN